MCDDDDVFLVAVAAARRSAGARERVGTSFYILQL